MSNAIGTAYGHVDHIDALLGKGAGHEGRGALVMNPSTFIALLGLTMQDEVVVGHARLTVAATLDWLIHADNHRSLPFLDDDGKTGMIPLHGLERVIPSATLAPTHAAAFRARVERVDAEIALGIAANAETRALLALVV